MGKRKLSTKAKSKKAKQKKQCEKTDEETQDSTTDNVSLQLEALQSSFEKCEVPKIPVETCQDFETIEAIDDNTENSNSGGDNLKFIKTNDSGILVLGKSQKVAVEGCCQFQVLCGKIEVFGYKIHGNILDKQAKIYDMHSPQSSSLLYLRDNSEAKITGKTLASLKKFIHKAVDRKDWENEFNSWDIYSCISLRQKQTHLPKVLKTLNNYLYLLSPFQVHVSKHIGVLETSQWKPIFNEIQHHMSKEKKDQIASIMLCGGKDVGKSCLSKYIINSLLTSHNSVMYLECDCGQTEFTLPGTLSLVNVTKPLFGPAFTQSFKPEKSYFYGRISPKDDPSGYMKILKKLYEHYQQNFSGKIPLVINQQGWVRGLGLNLLIDCFRIISPCITIQIQSNELESRNLPADLSDSFIDQQIGWMTHKNYQREYETLCQKNYFKIESQSNTALSSNKSMISRNLSISSYFSKCYLPFYESFEKKETWLPPPLSHIQPYEVSWENLAVHVIQNQVPRDLLIHSLNMSLVCLATVDEDQIEENLNEFPNGPRFLSKDPFISCFGFGIVRNIDFKRKVLYIITPESKETLNRVNAIVKGDIQLPSLYLTQDNRSNHPYYCYNYGDVSSKIGGKSKPRYNLKRKPSKLKRSMEAK